MNMFNEFLHATASSQSNSVQSYICNNHKVWLKKASKRHGGWIYWPLQWFSRLLGLHMLAPVPNLGGEKSIACEVSRLTQLRQLGINVPELLAADAQALLIKDAAGDAGEVKQLEGALAEATSSQQRLDLYQHAILAIEQIHAKDTYLSEAFARNILIDQAQNFSFIDFETDPGQYLSLKDCQTRDWLCFIFSTARFFEMEELPQVQNMLSQVLEKHPGIFQDVCRVGKKLKWVLKLKPEALGSDGRMSKCIHLLTGLNLQQPLPMI